MRLSPLLLLLTVAATSGCQMLLGVTPCRHHEKCPDNETCDEAFGVCRAAADPPADPVAPTNTDTAEGEGDANTSEGEGELAAGEGEGDDEAGEGEGEGEVGFPPGEGEGEASIGEGEGEGEGDPADVPPVLAAICGDGVVGPGEDCDDSNRISGDGCSATCRLDVSAQEVELNDFPDDPSPLDLTPNDGSITVKAKIDLNFDSQAQAYYSEPDGYWLHLPSPAVVRIETFDKPGVDDCQGAVTNVQLYRGDITPQTTASSFMREAGYNGIANCSVLTENLAAGTYWVVTMEMTGTQAIASYHEQVSVLADRGAESEPNNDIINAEHAAKDGLDVTMAGSIATADDVDIYAVDVPAGRGLRAEVIPTNSTTGCDAFNARIAVVDSAGELGTRSSTYGGCPYVDGTGSAPLDSAVKNSSFVARTMYVAVAKGSSGFTGALSYKIALTVR